MSMYSQQFGNLLRAAEDQKKATQGTSSSAKEASKDFNALTQNKPVAASPPSKDFERLKAQQAAQDRRKELMKIAQEFKPDWVTKPTPAETHSFSTGNLPQIPPIPPIGKAPSMESSNKQTTAPLIKTCIGVEDPDSPGTFLTKSATISGIVSP